MIKAGVVIDKWKLKVFEEHLKGFQYTKEYGIAEGMVMLQVFLPETADLEKVILAAQEKCAILGEEGLVQ